MPRECDGSDCDYETYVDQEGRARASWVHHPDCDGPVLFTPPGTSVVSENFLAYLQERA